MQCGEIADDDDDVLDAALSERGNLVAQNRLTVDRGQTLGTLRGVGQQTASRASREDDGLGNVRHELMPSDSRRRTGSAVPASRRDPRAARLASVVAFPRAGDCSWTRIYCLLAQPFHEAASR